MSSWNHAEQSLIFDLILKLEKNTDTVFEPLAPKVKWALPTDLLLYMPDLLVNFQSQQPGAGLVHLLWFRV